MDPDNETPSENVMVTVRAPMNVLRKDPDASLDDALRRELNEELTAERALSFFEDGVISVEPLDEYNENASEE